MSTFTALLNRTLTVTGRTQNGEDAWGQPVWDEVVRGTVRGRIDPQGGRGQQNEVVNGPDLNPIISDFLAITELPSGFEILELDTITDDTGAYEVLTVASLDGRYAAHHLQINLRRVA
jgi:hypothetical protein